MSILHVYVRVLIEARSLQLIMRGIFEMGYSELIIFNIPVWELLLGPDLR